MSSRGVTSFKTCDYYCTLSCYHEASYHSTLAQQSTPFHCLFSFLKLINEPFLPLLKKYFFFNYLNFPPRAVCLSATSASASCSADHPPSLRSNLNLAEASNFSPRGLTALCFLTGVKLPPGPNEKL